MIAALWLSATELLCWQPPFLAKKPCRICRRLCHRTSAREPCIMAVCVPKELKPGSWMASHTSALQSVRQRWFAMIMAIIGNMKISGKAHVIAWWHGTWPRYRTFNPAIMLQALEELWATWPCVVAAMGMEAATVTVASSPTTAAADSAKRCGSTLGPAGPPASAAAAPRATGQGYEAFKSGVFYFAHVRKKDAWLNSLF